MRDNYLFFICVVGEKARRAFDARERRKVFCTAEAAATAQYESLIPKYKSGVTRGVLILPTRTSYRHVKNAL